MEAVLERSKIEDILEKVQADLSRLPVGTELMIAVSVGARGASVACQVERMPNFTECGRRQ